MNENKQLVHTENSQENTKQMNISMQCITVSQSSLQPLPVYCTCAVFTAATLSGAVYGSIQ